jgi:telomerase reverse transcriptase
MFFDTSHNARRTVLANLYAALGETATKMWAYARCMTAAGSRPGARVFVGESVPVCPNGCWRRGRR